MLEYFQRQAGLLAERGELILLFLRHREQSIAFEYGWSCGRIYYSPKVGYDERFRHLSPGQLLLLLWLERLFRDRSHDLVDFAGPLSEATDKWTTRSYSVQKLIAGFGIPSRLLIGAARAAKGLREQLGRLSTHAPFSKTSASAKSISEPEQGGDDGDANGPSISERPMHAPSVEVASGSPRE
jgi:CelD/BcsL family acetyltransferase involved in cellulose biosynthesis